MHGPTGIFWANLTPFSLQVFYNSEMIFEGRALCGNREGCPPVSLFEDERWHSVDLNIIPDGIGGAKVKFDLDRGAYAGYGILADYKLPSPAYLGFTARTGGRTNNHYAKSITYAPGLYLNIWLARIFIDTLCP